MTVFATGPLLIVKWSGSEERFLPRFPKSLNVLGVENALAKVGRPHFIERKPHILKRYPVCVHGFTIGIQNDDRLRNKIDDMPQLLFLLTETSLDGLPSIASLRRCCLLDRSFAEAEGCRVRAEMLLPAIGALRV